MSAELDIETGLDALGERYQLDIEEFGEMRESAVFRPVKLESHVAAG